MECSGEFPFTLKVIELGQNKRKKPVTSCVVEHGGDQAAAAASVHRHRLKGHARRAFEVLCDLIAETGQHHPSTPGGVLSVPEEWWRERFYERAMPGAETGNKRQAFHRATKELIEENRLVAIGRGRLWIPAQP